MYQITEATLQYATKLVPKKRDYKPPQSYFETTQHDYGKQIVFERTIRSANGEIESLAPKDEHVYEMPPAGKTVKDPHKVLEERRFREEQPGAKKDHRKISFFSMKADEFKGGKWKDF